MRALLIAGSPLTVRTVSEHLRSAQCQVELASTGEDALDLARHYEFDVVIMDLDLTDMRGAALIRRMRTSRVTTPVLALSNRPQPGLATEALNAGADDVMQFPPDRAEMHARLRGLVRRSRGHSHEVLSVGPVSLNATTREVTAVGKVLNLTAKETAVLELLMLRRNLPLSKEVFLTQLYGATNDEPESKIIDVFICKLRRKLADAGAPNLIETVWGRGYMMRDDGRTREPVLPVVASLRRPVAELA